MRRTPPIHKAQAASRDILPSVQAGALAAFLSPHLET
jgi:hypothetical protein